MRCISRIFFYYELDRFYEKQYNSNWLQTTILNISWSRSSCRFWQNNTRLGPVSFSFHDLLWFYEKYNKGLWLSDAILNILFLEIVREIIYSRTTICRDFTKYTIFWNLWRPFWIFPVILALMLEILGP